MGDYRTARSLLLERDPEKLREGTPALQSLRDANYLHQRAAMAAGYNSLTDMAVDELIVIVGELRARMEALEESIGELRSLPSGT